MKIFAAALILLVYAFSGCKQNPVQSSEPVVEILSPVGNISGYDSVAVAIRASDDEKIIRVELFIDHELAHVFIEEPYEYLWNTMNYIDGSQHVLDARAYDEDGNVSGTKPVIVYTYKFRPSNLAATFISDTTVNLFWTDNSKVETGFEIEKKVNNGEFVLVRKVLANVTNATLECSNAFTDTVYYRVRAVKGIEKSEYSNNAVAYRTLSAPTNIQFAFESDTTIRMSWKDNTAYESEYRIQIGNQFYKQVPANTTEYTASLHLVNGMTYNVAVTAVRGGFIGNNGYSPNKQYVVPIPYGMSMTSKGINQLTITWQDTCAYEKGFIIERSDFSGTYSTIGRTAANVLQYIDSNIDTAKQYIYRVRTESKYTISSPSQDITVGYAPGLNLKYNLTLPNFAYSLTLSKDQKKAVTTSFNGMSISIWNAESMTLERNIEYYDSTAQTPQCAELHPDGKTLAVGFFYRYAMLFDAGSGNRIAAIDQAAGDREGVRSIGYNSDGTKWFTSGNGIIIWQDKTNVKLGSVSDNGYMHPAKYSPTEEIIISNPGTGGSVNVYDVNSFSLLRELDNSVGADVYSFNADGSLIVGETYSGILVWDSKTGMVVNQLPNVYNAIFVEMNANKDILFTSQQTGGISIWSLKTHKLLFNVKEDLSNYEIIKLSNDGKYLYSVGEKRMRKWEITNEWRVVKNS